MKMKAKGLSGSGWHNDSIPHSNARKFGSAGGTNKADKEYMKWKKEEARKERKFQEEKFHFHSGDWWREGRKFDGTPHGKPYTKKEKKDIEFDVRHTFEKEGRKRK